MLRILRLSALIVAVASAFAGAVTAVLPALVVGLVTLFYNRAGGALTFLGNLGSSSICVGLPQTVCSLSCLSDNILARSRAIPARLYIARFSVGATSLL
jgi:hypothetical protein